MILTNATDTFISEIERSRNWGKYESLITRGGTGTNIRPLVYFATPFPAGATILSAKLRMVMASSTTGSRTITVKRVVSKWSQLGTTWNSAPTDTNAGSVALTKGASPVNTTWEWDVTTMMQQVADGAPWYGVVLQSSESNPRWWYSADARNRPGPVLEITWTTAPDKPSVLTPSAGAAVSVAKPVLRFDFTDTAGDRTMSAYELQIDPAANWTAPSFTTGVVTTGEAQAYLAATSYAGLALNASTQWRVRVRDGSGLWSAWSDPAAFVRTAKGTLTVSGPTAITTPTPTVTWSLTGATQATYQVQVREGSTVLYDTGRRTGAVTSWTIPEGVLTKDGTNYEFSVLVMDTVHRASTPGDPDFLAASRTAVFSYDAAVVAPSAVAAAQVGDTPHVALTWTRATGASAFVIARDGVVVATREASEVLVSGTSYKWTDTAASPGSHTYTVRAIVGGLTSNASNAAAVTTSVVGIWLSDTAGTVLVQVLRDDEGSWSMGEVAATHTPVGGRFVVRTVQALRGYEGTLTGELHNYGGRTVESQVAQLWAIKANPGRQYLLTLPDMSIPVIVGDINVQPTPTRELTKKVSFNFWQVGGDMPWAIN